MMTKTRSVKRKKKRKPHLHVRGVGERVPISHRGRSPKPPTRPRARLKTIVRVGGTGGDTFLGGDANPFVQAVTPGLRVEKDGTGNGLKHAAEPPLRPEDVDHFT